MLWVKWNSIETFNAWHSDVKAKLGLPKESVDAEGNTIENSLIITDYVMPIIVADNDIRALIDDGYATDLEPSTNPIVSNYEASSL
jgi:hypothetical protein